MRGDVLWIGIFLAIGFLAVFRKLDRIIDILTQIRDGQHGPAKTTKEISETINAPSADSRRGGVSTVESETDIKISEQA